AEHLLIAAPSHESGLDDARHFLAQAREELLRAQGRLSRTQAVPQLPRTQDNPGGDSLHARLEQVLNLNNERLVARAHGRLSEALRAFFYCVSSLHKLEEEARVAGMGELQEIISYHLSGAYANLGFTLADIARCLDVFNQLQRSNEPLKLTPQTRTL